MRKSARHCFISGQGDLLPRWREAFPSAIALLPDEEIAPGSIPVMAWVRLEAARPVAEQLSAVRRQIGDVPLIALSDHPGDDEAIACFAAAARGYCNTHAVATLLRRIADVVLQGGLWIGESLMGRLLAGVSQLPSAVSEEWRKVLSPREQEVALAVAGGAANKEIARRLGISDRTVKGHVSAIFVKLGVRDRLQLALRISGRLPS